MAKRTVVRRRQTIVAIGAVVALACGIAVLAFSASATVSNPGSVTLTVSGGHLSTAFGAIEPLTGTMSNGTVDSSGHLNFTKANISFGAASVTVASFGVTVDVATVANSAFTGTINPDTGALSLSGSLILKLSGVSGALDNCPLGPMSIAANTTATGHGAVHYNKSNGTATVLDESFTIPAIATGQAGCGGIEGIINGCSLGLCLPSTSGALNMLWNVSVAPTLLGSTTTTTTTTTVPTTTEPGTTTTTAPGTTTSTAPAPTTTTAAATTTTVPTATTTLAPPEGDGAAVDNDQPAAGSTATVSGDGWMPDSTVDVVLHSTPVSLGTADVNSDGSFSKSVTIPAGIETGSHAIEISGTDGSGAASSASLAITVTAAATTTTVAPGRGTLPFTGSSLLPLLVVAMSSIAAGLALRRRRRIA